MNSSTYRAEDPADFDAALIAKNAIFTASTTSKAQRGTAPSIRIISSQSGSLESHPSIDHSARSIEENTQPQDAEDNDGMTSVTKDLLDARLEAVEARMDARMARIEGLVASIAKSQDEVAASHKSTRNTIIGTGIAVVLGIAAFNATVLSNMVASFESGKNTVATQAASEKAITEATKALEAATEKAKQATPPKK